MVFLEKYSCVPFLLAVFLVTDMCLARNKFMLRLGKCTQIMQYSSPNDIVLANAWVRLVDLSASRRENV